MTFTHGEQVRETFDFAARCQGVTFKKGAFFSFPLGVATWLYVDEACSPFIL